MPTHLAHDDGSGVYWTTLCNWKCGGDAKNVKSDYWSTDTIINIFNMSFCGKEPNSRMGYNIIGCSKWVSYQTIHSFLFLIE